MGLFSIFGKKKPQTPNEVKEKFAILLKENRENTVRLIRDEEENKRREFIAKMAIELVKNYTYEGRDIGFKEAFSEIKNCIYPAREQEGTK